jgi:hypothetical protein
MNFIAQLFNLAKGPPRGRLAWIREEFGIKFPMTLLKVIACQVNADVDICPTIFIIGQSPFFARSNLKEFIFNLRPSSVYIFLSITVILIVLSVKLIKLTVDLSILPEPLYRLWAVRHALSILGSEVSA